MFTLFLSHIPACKPQLAPQQYVICVIDEIIELYITNLIFIAITDKTLGNVNITFKCFFGQII